MVQHQQQATVLGAAAEIDGAADRSLFQVEPRLRLLATATTATIPIWPKLLID